MWLPDALSRKYPGAGRELAWQYVFPAARLSFDPRSGVQRRHHLVHAWRVLRSRVRGPRLGGKRWTASNAWKPHSQSAQTAVTLPTGCFWVWHALSPSRASSSRRACGDEVGWRRPRHQSLYTLAPQRASSLRSEREPPSNSALHATRAAARYFESYTSARSPRA